jgi:hypothetical protein
VNLDTFLQSADEPYVLLQHSVNDLALWNMQQMAQSRIEKMNQLQLALDIKVIQINQLERIFESRTWRFVRFFERSFREVKKRFG